MLQRSRVVPPGRPDDPGELCWRMRIGDHLQYATNRLQGLGPGLQLSPLRGGYLAGIDPMRAACPVAPPVRPVSGKPLANGWQLNASARPGIIEFDGCPQFR